MRKELRLAVSLLPALLALAGCDGNNVLVQSQSDSSAPVQQSSGPQSEPSGSSAGSSSGNSSASGDSPKVFFERILTDGTQIDQLIAISFSSQDSRTTMPAGVALKTPENFSSAPIFAPLGDQVVYLQSNGLVSDSLVSTTLGTLATQPLYDYPSQVAAMSYSASRKTAWIDEMGDVSVTDLASGQSLAIALPQGAVATSIQLSASGTHLLVATGGNALLVYGLAQSQSQDQSQDQSQGQWTLQFQASGVTAAALDRGFQKGGKKSEHRLAYVQNGPSGEGKLSIVNLGALGSASPSVSLVARLQSSTAYDFAWSSDATSVLYWSPTSTGTGEIRRVVVQPGASGGAASGEQQLARVNVPSSVTSGVVCPAWDGAALFYADFAQGEYAIQRAQVQRAQTGSATLAEALPFAVPPASDEGFVCPILSQGAGQ